MRGRLRWVGAVVVTSATVGAGAAIINTPVPNSQAAAISHVRAASRARDVLTPEINSLASQAQQLGSQIASAQAELSHLQQEVAYEAELSRHHPTAATTTSLVAHVTTTTERAKRREQGDSATGESRRVTSTTQSSTTTTVAPTTTTSSTTSTTTPTTTTTQCTYDHGDASSAASTAAVASRCGWGGGNDN
jgi:hypothetical protein